MNPAAKRFAKTFEPIADAVAKLDIDQEVREEVAEALAEALDGRPDFRRDLFTLIASDPLCPCVGHGDEPCPDGTLIRVAMHYSGADDGRSAAWERRRPAVRCIGCGSAHFMGVPR